MSQMHYFCLLEGMLGPRAREWPASMFTELPVEFFSETGAVLASYASDPDAPFCDEVSSKEARDP
jgi:hypothetical protein